MLFASCLCPKGHILPPVLPAMKAGDALGKTASLAVTSGWTSPGLESFLWPYPPWLPAWVDLGAAVWLGGSVLARSLQASLSISSDTQGIFHFLNEM